VNGFSLYLKCLAGPSRYAALLAAGALALGEGRAETYVITDLGTLSSSHNGAALSINSAGEAAGVFTAGNESRAFLYTTDGKLTDLGTLKKDSGAEAVSINDNGQVAGTSFHNVQSVEVPHAFLRKNKKLLALGTLPPSGSSTAAAVNNEGIVVGESGGFAFAASNGRMRPLGVLPGESGSQAGAINGAGTIAGNSGARLFRSDGAALTDLGKPPGAVSLSANGINGSNEIVGSYRLSEDGEDRAFRYAGGAFTDLGSLSTGAIAHGINNSGRIVGTSGNKAFLYKGGVMSDLNTLVTLAGTSSVGFVELTRALSINDGGKIAGEGRFRDAGGAVRLRPFILTPVPDNAAPAPVVSPATGEYPSTVIVSITSLAQDAIIRYTTNGTEPTASSLFYSRPFIVDASCTVKARAFVSGSSPSVVTQSRYTLIPALYMAALPAISPSAGTYPFSATITMTCPTPNALIRYTINGSDPTASSNPYIEPFVLRSSATVKARAFATGMAPSPPASTPYVISASDPDEVTMPRIWPNASNFTKSVRVKITCSTKQAVIFYTLDGSEPTSISTKYKKPFNLTQTTTVKARVYFGPNPSEITTATFTKAAPQP
jgi:probable HAF family extracellular repeat protein